MEYALFTGTYEYRRESSRRLSCLSTRSTRVGRWMSNGKSGLLNDTNRSCTSTSRAGAVQRSLPMSHSNDTCTAIVSQTTLNGLVSSAVFALTTVLVRSQRIIEDDNYLVVARSTTAARRVLVHLTHRRRSYDLCAERSDLMRIV